MRLVYMGTPDIARVCLQKLHESGFAVAGVYTKPDTPKNRGMKLAQSEVKEYAVSVGLPVYQPATFKDDAVYEELKALAPDLIVGVAYGKILPQRVLDIPKYGCINMHASILPELRGAGPVQWSILNHCDETGVTAMYLTAGMDEGDIIAIRKTPIDPMETSSELMARLADIAAELACDTVRAIENGTATRTPQDNARATYAPMLSKDMCPIDWAGTSREVIDHERSSKSSVSSARGNRPTARRVRCLRLPSRALRSRAATACSASRNCRPRAASACPRRIISADTRSK